MLSNYLMYDQFESSIMFQSSRIVCKNVWTLTTNSILNCIVPLKLCAVVQLLSFLSTDTQGLVQV